MTKPTVKPGSRLARIIHQVRQGWGKLHPTTSALPNNSTGVIKLMADPFTSLRIVRALGGDLRFAIRAPHIRVSPGEARTEHQTEHRMRNRQAQHVAISTGIQSWQPSAPRTQQWRQTT